MRRLLVPSSALLWGLQLAFLSPALALILVNLYGATTAEVGAIHIGKIEKKGKENRRFRIRFGTPGDEA